MKLIWWEKNYSHFFPASKETCRFDQNNGNLQTKRDEKVDDEIIQKSL